MDNVKLGPENPRDKAGILSHLTFWWLLPILRLGYKRPLQEEDIYRVQEDDSSKYLADNLQKHWDRELSNFKLNGKRPSFVNALWHTFKIEFIGYGLLAFLEECVIRNSQPVFLGFMIRYMNSETQWKPWLFSSLIIVANVIFIFVHHPFFFGVQRLGMKLRVASCALIYKKSLRLSRSATDQTTVGQMVNLLSNDVNRFDTAMILAHHLWVGPIQTVIVTIVMWYEIGPSCLAGILVLILFVPLQTYMGSIFSRLRLKTAERTDERIRVMNETVTAMQVIKMYAWEIPFTKMLELARKKEINVIRKTSYFRAINMSLYFISSKIIVFLALLTYVLTGNVLTAEKVFVVSALINNIRLTMTLFFPFAISNGSETLISCRRIQEFLEMEEVEECNRVQTTPARPAPQQCKLEGENITAKWKFSSENVLSNVSFKVSSGELLNVIGSIGCGKSSLLQTVLGELPIDDGQLKVAGKVSYAAQEPWLFAGSVRKNILLANPYDPKKYNEVIRVCSLQRDFELFPNGDSTIVGDRGESLSGGQRARISLARAVYADADIYLLDDPLSAVDAHVGKRLYEDCIVNYLRSKVRILVTHQVQYLKNAAKIMVLNNGYVEHMGSYTELVDRGVDFTNIAKESEQEEEVKLYCERRPSVNEAQLISRVTRLRRDSEAWVERRGSRMSVADGAGITANPLMRMQAAKLGASTTSLDQDYDEDEFDQANKYGEVKKEGSISGKVYLGYFQAGGGFLTSFMVLFTSILTQILYSGSDYWLSFWTNQEQRTSALQISEGINIISYNESESLNLTGTVYEDQTFNFERETYVYVYSGMTGILFLLALVRTVSFFLMCMKASKNLHNAMLYSLFQAPMNFFDSRPIGVVLNRTTKDIGQIDEILPTNMFDFLEIMFTLFGILVVVACINVWIVLPTVVLALLFFFVRNFYMTSARDIKRLEGITRSPVFSHLSTTLNGLSTIRAFKVQNEFIVGFDLQQDVHSSTWFLLLSAGRWFGVCLDAVTTVYLAVVTFSFMESSALGGDVGLAISSALSLSGMFQWGVRQSAEVESQMTSVERVIEYSKLPVEEKPYKQLEKPRKKWPHEGRIAFKNVSLRFNEYDPPVLKKLQFTIKAGRKVGIVGRTGAGKSTLITCLFRIAEPEGIIEIDSVPINNIPLRRLRSSISIIPQAPTLFSGTLRYNLDPFNLYNDDELWSVIAEVQLTSFASESGKGLEAMISEGGGNLSVGQRQLLCLARAILRKSRILVMDEATANVDQKTDSLIQTTIREKFKECTVLTVAHRLNTIIDCDRVMVLSAGRLVEYEEPYLLMQKPTSVFSSMILETGVSNANHLHSMAKQAFHERHSEVKRNLIASRIALQANGTAPKASEEEKPSQAEEQEQAIEEKEDEGENTKL